MLSYKQNYERLNNPSGGGKEAMELSLFKIVTVVSSMKC